MFLSHLNYRLSPTARPSFKEPTKQKGISLAFLLFTIVIVSLLAAGLMRLNAQSGISTVHQVISTRAFFAAESGANLQALAVFPVNGAAGTCSSQNFNFTNSGLASCTATTSCSTVVINSNNYYQIVSQGQCNSGQPLQATRTIEVRLKQIINP